MMVMNHHVLKHARGGHQHCGGDVCHLCAMRERSNVGTVPGIVDMLLKFFSDRLAKWHSEYP